MSTKKRVGSKSKSKQSTAKVLPQPLTFVKWAGGKTQLIEQFKAFFPEKIERYFEPFVGSGAVFFYIMQEYKPKEAFISDTNQELITAYEVIRDNVSELIELLKKHRANHSKKYFYEIRALEPKELTKIEVAARFIYLNKTCFNGLYRVNAKGKFNVPMGSYKNPAIFNETKLHEASKLLQNVTIKAMDFNEIVNLTAKGDFIYFDPPYYPLQDKKSFTSYTKDAFLEKEQKDLKEAYDQLDKQGCKVMLSNSDTEFIKGLYKKYFIAFVRANRMINCNGSGRGKVNEVVITNYPIEEQKQN